MGSIGARDHVAGARGGLPVRHFTLLALVLIAVLPAAVRWSDPGAGWIALTAAPLILAAMSLIAVRAMVGMSYPHDRLGGCNAVTLLRGALVAGLAATLATPSDPAWGTVAVASVALALDGLDGWLARRAGLASDFGARFDMEVDAFLALVLSLLALQADKAGLWVLVLGGLRYGYVAAAVFLTWLQHDLPPRLGRKTVCVIQIATLIALLAPPVTPPMSHGLAAVATALLIWSFAVDILWLWRRR